MRVVELKQWEAARAGSPAPPPEAKEKNSSQNTPLHIALGTGAPAEVTRALRASTAGRRKARGVRGRQRAVAHIFRSWRRSSPSLLHVGHLGGDKRLLALGASQPDGVAVVAD